MWTLRLRGPKGKSATIQIEPSDTLQAFSNHAAEVLGLRSKKNLTFRSGYPPQSISYLPSDQVQAKFVNQDTVVVDTTTTPSAAAAMSASSSKASARSTAIGKRLAKAASNPPTRGVHTLHGSNSKSALGKRKIVGDGVRLGNSLEDANEQDVESDRVESHSSGPKYRRTRAIQLGSKDSVAESLVSAVSGASNDRAAKFFRAATKTAVDYQYQITKATARLNAALSNNFEIEEVTTCQRTGISSGDGDSSLGVEMRVRFKESVRKWSEETVSMLQPRELQACLKYVLLSGGETAKEMLKPFNMAQCSPRVFWSIARLYHGDVSAGLEALLPEEDWSYLDIRTRQQSKKAMEAQANEQMYKEWKYQSNPKNKRVTLEDNSVPDKQVIEILNSDEEKSPVKPEAPKHSTAALAARNIALQKRAMRDAVAQAAVSRFQVNTHADHVESALSTPRRVQEDDDDDDLEPTTTVYCDACHKARILSLAEEEKVGVQDQDKEWTCSRLGVIEGRDATCEAVDDELVQLGGTKFAELLQTQAMIKTRKDFVNIPVVGTILKHLTNPLQASYASMKTKVEAMLNEARLDEVNDAMVDIVGGNEVLDVLELQKLGTPADLLETPTDMIVMALRDVHVDVDTVRKWQEQAREYIDTMPWMGEWRTI